MNIHDQTNFIGKRKFKRLKLKNKGAAMVMGATKQEAQKIKEKKEVRMVWAFTIFAVALFVGSWAAIIEYFSGFVRSVS